MRKRAKTIGKVGVLTFKLVFYWFRGLFQICKSNSPLSAVIRPSLDLTWNKESLTSVSNFIDGKKVISSVMRAQAVGYLNGGIEKTVYNLDFMRFVNFWL